MTSTSAMVQRSRRLVWLWLLLSVLFVGCTAVLAVPTIWLVRGTVGAEAGESCPECAALAYVSHMHSGEEIGLRPLLDRSRRSQLMVQWTQYRSNIAQSMEVPDKLEVVGDLQVHRQGDTATVTLGVRAVWFPDEGRRTFHLGGTHPWRFEVRKSRSGWRVWTVELPNWCQSHARCG